MRKVLEFHNADENIFDQIIWLNHLAWALLMNKTFQNLNKRCYLHPFKVKGHAWDGLIANSAAYLRFLVGANDDAHM